MANRELGRLTLDVVTKTGGFTRGMSKAERSMGKFNKASGGMLGKMTRMKAGLLALGVAAVTAASKLSKMAAQQIDVIDSQISLAESTNSTVEAIRDVEFAARSLDLGNISKDISRFTRRLGEVEVKGTGRAVKGLEALGMEASDLSGLDIDVQIGKIGDRLNEMGVSAGEAQSILKDLGFTTEEANRLFREGSEGLKEHSKAADAAGQSLDSMDYQNIKDAKGAFDRVAEATRGFKDQLAAALAPALELIANILAKTIELAAKAVAKIKAFFRALTDLTDAGTKAENAIKGVEKAQEDLQSAEGFDAAQTITDVEGTRSNYYKYVVKPAIEERERAQRALEENTEQLRNQPGGMSMQGERLIGKLKEEAQRAAEEAEDVIDVYNNISRDIIDARQRIVDFNGVEEGESESFDIGGTQPSITGEGQVRDPEDLAQSKDPIISAGVQDLLDYDKTRAELLRDTYENDIEELDEAREEGAITEQQYHNARLNAWDKYLKARNALNQGADQDLLGSSVSALDSLESITASHNSKMAKLAKAAGIANALISTYRGAAKALELPFPENIAAYAKTLATGLGAVSKIKSVSYSGGSSGSSSISSDTSESDTSQAGRSDSGEVQNVFIRGLRAEDMYSGEQIMDIMNHQIRSGGKIVGFGD